MTYNDYKKTEKLINEKTEELASLKLKRSDLQQDFNYIKKYNFLLKKVEYNYSFSNNYAPDIKDFLLQKIQEKIDKLSKEIQLTEIFIHNITLQLK